jgi:hypothetical protein
VRRGGRRGAMMMMGQGAARTEPERAPPSVT